MLQIAKIAIIVKVETWKQKQQKESAHLAFQLIPN